jgi:hypothetical protein
MTPGAEMTKIHGENYTLMSQKEFTMQDIVDSPPKFAAVPVRRRKDESVLLGGARLSHDTRKLTDPPPSIALKPGLPSK